MIADSNVQTASAIMSAISAMIGFVAPWPEVVVGVCFAVAGGFAGLAFRPAKAAEESLTIPYTFFVALVIGVIVGLIHPHITLNTFVAGRVSDWPLVAVMAIAGIASPWIAKKAATGEFSLPWKGKGSP